MKIRVSDKHIGEVTLDVYTNIGKCEEYTLKSLCMLQMMCMNNTDSAKFTEFIKIIKEAVDKASDLYQGVVINDANPTDHFGD